MMSKGLQNVISQFEKKKKSAQFLLPEEGLQKILF